MKKLRSILSALLGRILNILISFDQFVWVLITLGYAHPDETISAACWRMELAGKWQGKFFRPIIDWTFLKLFGEKDHCLTAYKAERNGWQLPKEYREEVK